MTKLTYSEAYDKIIQTYFNDEIKPYDGNFCFCGNLNDNNCTWGTVADNKNYYTPLQYRTMEAALLDCIQKKYIKCPEWSLIIEQSKNYEDWLFDAMCAALDVLKEIHRSRGEDVDTIKPVFLKRTKKVFNK